MDVSPANRATISAYDAMIDAELDAWNPEGDDGRRLLLNPAILSLLGDVTGKRVLDAGCGQGYLSRLLAERGAHVVGVDAAQRLVEYAKRLKAERQQGIEYHRRDLSRLGDVGVPFDSVVANMVLLDIADWRAAMANCVGALRGGGRFIFSLHHPCWPATATASWSSRGAVEISEYLNEYEVRGGVGGSVNYHRPLSGYLDEAIDLGCRIIRIVEPALAPGAVEEPEHEILVHVPNFIVIAADRDVPG
jgi:SAM-dependent methyltransferase